MKGSRSGTVALLFDDEPELKRVASRSLLAEVLTVKRIDCGLIDAGAGGPRETVAVALDSRVVRRDRCGLDGGGDASSAMAWAALTAAERWTRRDDMLN